MRRTTFGKEIKALHFSEYEGGWSERTCAPFNCVIATPQNMGDKQPYPNINFT